MEMLVLIALVGGGVLLYRYTSADRAGPDLAWTGGAAKRVGKGPASDAPLTPYRSVAPASPTRTAAALSRIETSRLLASPLLWVGVALTLLACLAALDSGIPDQSEWLSLSGRFIPLLIFPLCGMVVIAANRATLRPRRDGTDELMESLPAARSTRTLALVLAQRGPVLVGVAATALLAISVWFGGGKRPQQSLWSRSDLGVPFSHVGVANIVAAIVLVACAGALGIGLARLLPWGLVPIVAVVVIGVATGVLSNDDLPVVVTGSGPLAWGADLPAFLSPVAQGWHVVYLVGLAIVAIGAAFLLDGNRRWGTSWLAVAAVLVAIGAIGQSRTYAGDTAQQIADLVTDPAAHQQCIESASARVCHFPELSESASGWLTLAGAVNDAAPPAASDGPVEVHTRLSAEEIAQLAAPVRAELDRRGNAYPWTDEPGMHPDLRWGNGDGDGLRALLVAHELVGLPEPGAPPDVPCYAGGQARAAVAVALAGRAVADPEDYFRSGSAGTIPTDTGTDFGDPTVTDLADEDWEIDSRPVVVHTESDLALGRALLARPVGEVREVLASDWDRWVDPATPTAELAATFGLDAGNPAQTPEGLEACR